VQWGGREGAVYAPNRGRRVGRMEHARNCVGYDIENAIAMDNSKMIVEDGI